MLKVDRLDVAYGPILAVSEVDLEIADGEVVALLGPSGCGKSTLLRAIAGLERPTNGTISWNGNDLAGIPIHRRGFGLVFQDGQLFPHRDVAGNVSFGLRMRATQQPPPTLGGGPAASLSAGGVEKEGRRGGLWITGRRGGSLWTTAGGGESLEAGVGGGESPGTTARRGKSGGSGRGDTERVDEMLELVGLSGYGGRRVTELSGGEQQRVALARALAPHPRLLLLDEPLSALDRALREQLAIDLARLLRESGSTALVVTHDHDEAFTLADRVAVMRAGRIVQVGKPDEVWRRPVDEATARFLGCDLFLDATAENGVLTCEFGSAPVPWAPDGPLTAGLRPAALRVGDGPTVVTVTARVHRRDHVRLVVDTGGRQVDAVAGIADAPEVGARVRLVLDPDGVAVLSRRG
ncbi:TOBE domain-containing protein [Actinokineospora alba]|uniref:TOBE domain-containing protein n=1 Tax=Actinokineospora alba TaxID=504798 RepID=A0A1H0RQE1_9PSEU|nr:ABC transporter ATP-binding protein [Actinokineospora alba]TDP66963.1 TOBE domain-containing protein [Actinokineospora alba]SDJ32932.1 TOBE domain-containing protein [Actinokineospora alba]SDP31732.1 TOBE domain-containing protein [Actinokineospora alba]